MARARGWLWPLEHWVEERLVEVVEPRMQRRFEHWLREAAGRKAMADLLAEVMVDVVSGGRGPGGMLEEVVVALCGRLSEDPAVRRRLLAALGGGPGGADAAAASGPAGAEGSGTSGPGAVPHGL